MKKILAVLLAAVMGVSALAGCSGSKSQLEKIESSGTLTVYTNAEFPPYEYVGEGGEIIGVDVEIGKKIAEKIGVELEVKNTKFDGIVAGVTSGKADLGIAGITVTEERQQQVDMSHAYVESIQYLVVPEDSDLSSMADLAGKTVGGQTGTTGYMAVEDEINKGSLKDKNSEIKPFDSAPVAMQDLIKGGIDAVVIDELVAIEIANANPGYKAVPLTYDDGEPVKEQFAVAVKKGNEDLLEIVNEVIDELVESGQIDTWIDQYSVDE